ncbi:hypothetical protein STANM309S_06434 [Streptomyces tanashiensis]
MVVNAREGIPDTVPPSPSRAVAGAISRLMWMPRAGGDDRGARRAGMPGRKLTRAFAEGPADAGAAKSRARGADGTG